MSWSWTECYQQHFQKHFQKPFDIQVYHDPNGFALKLATHDLAMQGYRVYASMGLADQLVRNEEEDFGEVILYSDVPDKDVPQLFVTALFFILQNGIPLGSRFAINFMGSHNDFVKRYKKTALYFTRPMDSDEQFNKVRQEEMFGRVYQAVFISADEDAFLDAYGADVFEQELQKQPGDRNSVRRDSCV